ncbi:hypothetical protein H1V43_32410 [Streptomyces sp. PSKA54]|uniref:Uncharacterized protein n=1 Tax=Streptomyces himalayensis subsp. aureolus TaxID=2758039 RepID=A0A7W2HJC1_9ACTN|nr:hypothetical protein [Streptomyces himalayensis]MBA4865967.1 hypothetical protein [Streptomyces himalayensis subsp. aureolus]
MSPLRALRELVAPTDDVRPPAFRGVLDEASLEELLSSGDIEANDYDHCPNEQRTTFHAMHTDGSRTCWTCQATTPGDQ